MRSTGDQKVASSTPIPGSATFVEIDHETFSSHSLPSANSRLCWGLTTCQPLWVILCPLPEKGRRQIEDLIELGFNDTSNLVGHFVSSPREREKIDRRDSRRDEREGQGRKRNRNESEETDRRNSRGDVREGQGREENKCKGRNRNKL